jgi:hypothetical protein
MINRSYTTVRRGDRSQVNHAWVVGALAALSLFMLPASSQAAGCHTQDRPVISGTLSWEMDQGISHAAASIARPPAILTHPRCSDNIPLASGSTTLPAVAALLEHLSFASLNFGEPLIADLQQQHSQPPATRLDRPPRSGAAIS